MLTKGLQDLTIDDVLALKANGVVEGRFIEFKSEPVGGADRDRREFLADVTAFANASGGDIIFGVTTQDGLASDIPGIELTDPDKEKLRLGDMIRSGAEPRLTHFEMAWLRMEGSRGVLVVRVPRSWTAPHRVTLLGHDKFYTRNSAGKHPMNVDELRRAFTLSAALADRVRHFRDERIEVLRSGEGPLPLHDGPTLLLHIVPLSALVDPLDIPLSYAANASLRPFGASGWSHLHTLEGFVTYPGGSQDENGRIRAYTLAFRSGIIEAAGVLPAANNDARLISLSRIERYVLEGWTTYIPFLAQRQIEPPFYVLVSLIGVRGYAPPTDTWNDVHPTSFRRDLLLLPEMEVSAEKVKEAPHVLFRRLFDLLANAFGLPQSTNYKADGTYKQSY